MSILTNYKDWLTFKNEHEYEHPMPWLVYFGGFFQKLGISIIFPIVMLFLLVISPGVGIAFMIGYYLGYFVIFMIGMWTLTPPRRYKRHLNAILFLISYGILIIPIFLIIYYYYFKENVKNYFDQFED